MQLITIEVVLAAVLMSVQVSFYIVAVARRLNVDRYLLSNVPVRRRGPRRVFSPT